MLYRAALATVAFAALVAGCKPSPSPVASANRREEIGVAEAATVAPANPLVGSWRCDADGSKLFQNADGTGGWKLDGGSAVGYRFKWTTEGQTLVLTTDRVPQPTRFQYAFDASGNLLITGADGKTMSYAREGDAPGNTPTTPSALKQRPANRGDGPRMWADEQIEQNHQELTRSAPQPTDAPDEVRKKVERLQAAAKEIRTTAGSGFPDRRAEYEQYAVELEVLASEWSKQLMAAGNTGSFASPSIPAGGNTDPLSSGFGAPPR